MAHVVLKRCGVEKHTKIFIRIPCDCFSPYGLSRRNDQVECEADETNYFRSRNLSAHIVIRRSRHVPGANITTSCCADARRIKLLRVLQEGEFERVGSSKPIKVNVRIIAATNHLAEAVKASLFRPDLFYRLNVFPLEIPPLRERKSDIPLLVNVFLGKFAKKLGKQVHGLYKDTMDRLMRYSWPGNIRELQNVIERAVVLAQNLIIPIDEHMLQLNTGLESSNSKRLEDIERSHILRVLEDTKWVIEGKRGAASALGLHPSTLRYRIKKLGIKKPMWSYQTD